MFSSSSAATGYAASLNRVAAARRPLCLCVCMGFYFGGTENQQSSWHTEAEETTTEPLFRGWPCSHWGFRGLPSTRVLLLLASQASTVLYCSCAQSDLAIKSSACVCVLMRIWSYSSCFGFYHTGLFLEERNIFLVQPVHVAKIVMIIFWNNKKSEFFSERKQKEIYFGLNQR